MINRHACGRLHALFFRLQPGPSFPASWTSWRPFNLFRRVPFFVLFSFSWRAGGVVCTIDPRKGKLGPPFPVPRQVSLLKRPFLLLVFSHLRPVARSPSDAQTVVILAHSEHVVFSSTEFTPPLSLPPFPFFLRTGPWAFAPAVSGASFFRKSPHQRS